MRQAEQVMAEKYGYTPRPGQSREFITVPCAVLQEAHDASPPGDARNLLHMALVNGRTHEQD